MNAIELSNIAEQKILLVQRIVSIEDSTKLAQIQYFINSIIEEPIESEEEGEAEALKDYDAKKLSFEEWNEQFEDQDLEKFLPEYGMTQHDFRMKIYTSERGSSMSFDEFVTKLDSLS